MRATGADYGCLAAKKEGEPLDDRPPRTTRDGGREGFAESTKWLTLADVARALGRPYSTVRSWRESGRLPAPDADHEHAPLWRAATIVKWESENLAKSVLTRRTVFAYGDCGSNTGLTKGADLQHTTQSFGISSLGTLLHYRSLGTVSGHVASGRIPAPFARDWDRGYPYWLDTQIAEWLLTDPAMLARVTDARMLALVSEARARLGANPEGAGS